MKDVTPLMESLPGGIGDIVYEAGGGYGIVYLLHFERPISEDSTAQHYIGWTSNLWQRMYYHVHGRGARLTQVAVERGIGFTVARAWWGDRKLERAIKDCHSGPSFCPICAKRAGRELQARELTAEQIEDILNIPF